MFLAFSQCLTVLPDELKRKKERKKVDHKWHDPRNFLSFLNNLDHLEVVCYDMFNKIRRVIFGNWFVRCL